MKRASSLLLVLLLAVTVAACGDDDVSDLGDGQTTSAPVFGGDGDGSDDDNTTFPTAVGNIPGVSSECEAYANLSLALVNVFSGGFSGFGGDLVSSLPPSGQADGAIIVDALQRFSDGMAAAGIDLSAAGGMATMDADQIATFTQLSEEIFTDDVDAAFDRLSELVEAECAVGG